MSRAATAVKHKPVRRETRRKSEPVFLTAADARRIEAAEEYGALRYAEAMRPEHPEWGVECEEFGGGHLVFVARRAPVGRAHALGFQGKITSEDIEHIEQFYFRHGADAQVDVCPYADPSLSEVLNERGFQVAEFNQTLARWIRPKESFSACRIRGIQIRQVRSSEARAWSALLAKVFFEDQAPQFDRFFMPWASSQHPLSLAAFVKGEMVAGASGLLVPEHKMGGFFGAATLPDYRGLGIQAAFMQERLRLVQKAGFDLAVTLTMPGTTSQRNVERAGFRTAYTKVVVRKKHPAGESGGTVQVHYSA